MTGEELCEYPDAIVGTYLQRAVTLADQRVVSARHTRAEEAGSWRSALVSALMWLFPVTWFTAVFPPLFAHALRRSTRLECKDPIALEVYEAFWQTVRLRDWDSPTKCGLNYGLWILRHRRGLADVHLRYARAVGEWVPAPAIDWNPPPVLETAA
jgi:hypothetical protein